MAQASISGRPLNFSSPFHEREIDLSALNFVRPVPIGMSGSQLLMKKDGSSINARVDVVIGGAVIPGLCPGARVVSQRFDNIGLLLSKGSIPNGTAKLLSIEEGFNFLENESTTGNYKPALLKSTIADADPLIATGAVSVPVCNFTQLRIYIRGNAGTLTDYQFTLGYSLPGVGSGSVTYFYASSAPIIGTGLTGGLYVETVQLVPLFATALGISYDLSNPAILSPLAIDYDVELKLDSYSGTATSVDVVVYGVK